MDVQYSYQSRSDQNLVREKCLLSERVKQYDHRDFTAKQYNKLIAAKFYRAIE